MVASAPPTPTRQIGELPNGHHRYEPPFAALDPDPVASDSARKGRFGAYALTGLRLAIGFEFLWAFLDKTFGWGYATPSARAWIHGGSPTKGFLSGVASGPLKGVFHSIAGAPVADWLFMLGLLGIGVALIAGVAVRVAAACGVAMLILMWFATWPPSTVSAGQPSGSTNPFVDDHIISALALVVVAVFAARGVSYLGHWWANQDLVKRFSWLR